MIGLLTFLLIVAVLCLYRQRGRLADARQLAEVRLLQGDSARRLARVRQQQIDALSAQIATLQAQAVSERERWDRAVRAELGYATA